MSTYIGSKKYFCRQQKSRNGGATKPFAILKIIHRCYHNIHLKVEFYLKQCRRFVSVHTPFWVWPPWFRRRLIMRPKNEEKTAALFWSRIPPFPKTPMSVLYFRRYARYAIYTGGVHSAQCTSSANRD